MALKEDIVIGMQSKHTTVDAMDASNTQHNYMYRMVYDTPVHFNNTTKELEPSLARVVHRGWWKNIHFQTSGWCKIP